MKTGVSGLDLQMFVDQTWKAACLQEFSQIGTLIKFVEFRKDFV